jgi:hypothetical protein
MLTSLAELCGWRQALPNHDERTEFLRRRRLTAPRVAAALKHLPPQRVHACEHAPNPPDASGAVKRSPNWGSNSTRAGANLG